jgi:CDP-paratose 2-epimerase
MIQETPERWEAYFNNGKLASIDETMSIDNSKHSIFGASKVAADILCQEYGKYFGMNVGVFRGGCLTGPNHAGAELHGFLSYLVKCIVHDKPYTIFGYKGKQVRDNIHSWDLVNMFWHFHQKPGKGEIYNAGGGRENSISIIEAIGKINKISGKNWNLYTVSSENRAGDHVWYISDVTKFKNDYPAWDISIKLDRLLQEMVEFELSR